MFNPAGLDLVVQSLSGGNFRLMSYFTDDDLETVQSAGYFTDAASYGLKLETIVMIFGTPGTHTEAFLGRIDSIDANGNATLVIDNSVQDAEDAQVAAELAQAAAEAAAAAAASSESNAATSASTATTQAGNAVTSADDAADSAAAALAAQIAAEAAQEAAEIAADNFDDVYLGSKSSDPTLDNDGNALVEGQLYWNSSTQGLKIYDGTSWVSYDPTSAPLGPATTTDNAIPRWDGVDGDNFQDSGVTIDDSNNVAGVANLSATTIDVGSSDTTITRASAGVIAVEGKNVQLVGGADVAVADGGTGASTAAAAATNLGLGTGDSPQFAGVNVGQASHATLTRASAGDVAVEGNIIYRAGGTDVPVTDGGTGSSTASGARTNLGLVIGTDVQAYDAQLSSLMAQNSKSAAYTLVATDSAKHIYHPSADTTARTWTIPANASVAFSIGTVITLVNDISAGALTIAITSDTLAWMDGAGGSTGSRTLAAGGVATIIKVASTRWVIFGTGLS